VDGQAASRGHHPQAFGGGLPGSLGPGRPPSDDVNDFRRHAVKTGDLAGTKERMNAEQRHHGDEKNRQHHPKQALARFVVFLPVRIVRGIGKAARDRKTKPITSFHRARIGLMICGST